MRRHLISGICAALVFSSFAFARTIVDGRLQVTPSKDNKYLVDVNVLGKAEFFGYVGDFVDNKKITGILLIKGDKATDEQKHIVAVTAATQHIDAFIDLDGKIQPLVDPTPSPQPAAAPALDSQAPVQQPPAASH